MKRLTICYLDFDDLHNPLLGAGQDRDTFVVGRRLASKGHTIVVLCSRYPGYQDRIEQGIVYHHIGLGTSKLRLNNLFYLFAAPFAARSIKADIIVECFTAPTTTLFTPLLTDVPVVAVTTSFDAKRFAEKYHLPFHWIEKIGLRFYQYALPTNFYLEEKLKVHNPNIITKVVPQGVEELYFQIKRTSYKHLLFLGRLDVQQKGIDLLLRAYAQVQHQIRYPLVIAGNGPDEEYVRSLINKAGLVNKVLLVGSAFGEKKYQLMSQAAAVIAPSRSECFGLFALETLAAGLPLIIFDIPGYSWVDPGVAIKVKPFSVELLAQAIKQVMQPDINTHLSDQARRFAQRFNWDQVALAYEEFFYQILEHYYSVKKPITRFFFNYGIK